VNGRETREELLSKPKDHELDTSGGKFPLFDYRLRRDGREWTVLHTGAVLTQADELHAMVLKTNRLPYGVSVWPSAIGLAHEIATRARAFHGRSVLELGAGVGLPGIVAASFGGRVVQTDREELALYLCKRNGERNGAGAIECRLSDWTEWGDAGCYDWIIASDILYGESLHQHLRRIFDSNLAPTGRILLADPFRGSSLRFLDTLEAEGWTVTFSKWDLGEESTPRPVGVFELVPPGSSAGRREIK
jgi:predicted nicotinamide N-methyase